MKRKLKLNKKFVPAPRNIGDELFPNGFFEFNITELIKFIYENQIQPQWVKVNSLSMLGIDRLDEVTVGNADLTIPIILAEISPDNFNVIDGHQRLGRARRECADEIMAYKISVEQHINFLTSVMAYESYVHYWNEKLKSRRIAATKATSKRSQVP
jgi:hypothetical protein